jgi:phosphomannomutase
MSLITSISGIRGTIGGEILDSLNPVNIVNFTVAYCQLLKQKLNKTKLRIVSWQRR